MNRERQSHFSNVTMVLAMNNAVVNIINYESSNYKRQCENVLPVELFAFVKGFGVGFRLVRMINKLYDRNVNQTMCTDSWSIYDLCISLSRTAQQRPQIWLALIWEANECQEITDVTWMFRRKHTGDDITRDVNHGGALTKDVERNRFPPVRQSWVRFDKKGAQKRK